MSDTEIFNPTRRYKHFRPREAARAQKTLTPTNKATFSLYNDTTGRSVLVVRDFTVQGTANDLVGTSYQSGQIGTSQGLVQPLMPSGGKTAGLLASIDTVTTYASDYILALSSLGAFVWQHDFPFAVIEPGWSLVFQAATAAHATTVAVVWESIQIDELDSFW